MRLSNLRWRVTGALTAVALATSGGILASGPAEAYPYTIQVVQIAPKVTKSKYYREFAQGRSVQTTDFDAGRLRVVAVPYRIKEGMRKYDQVLLNLKVSAGDKKGGSALAWANIHVKPLRYSAVSDSAATNDRQLGSCTTVDLKLNYSFGPISASTNVGKLKGCSGAQLDLTHHSTSTGSTSWQLRRLKKLTSTDMEIYLQVPRGVRPDYRITIETPIDSCAANKYLPPSQCIPTDYTSTISYVVKGQA